MVISVFTLVICLAVVALSGVAVLRITLVDQSKPATTRSRVPRAPAESESEPTAETKRPEPPRHGDGVDRLRSPGRPRPAADPTTVVIEAHRARSVGLLVSLLAALGGVLALLVAVLARIATAALRAALGS